MSDNYLTINRWRCRLGNNIIQLKNCLHIAFEMKCNVKIPPHKMFNTTFIKLFENPANVTIKCRRDFFDGADGVSNDVFSKHTDNVLKILRTVFIIKYTDAIIANESDLHIHIRSGDIFTRSGVHAKYIQPPLSFYTKIIDGESEKYKKIYIIAEDKRNPCINALIEKYKTKIQFNETTLINDIKQIIGAKNIIYGIGTFVPSLLLFNENIENIYHPNPIPNFTLTLNMKIKQHFIDISGYNKKIYPWKNTQQQKKLMLTYEI